MASHLPEEAAQPSLSEELRAATRQKHHALNGHIITRLPLCMPPHTNSPISYAKGMTVFSQIYLAFEELLAMHQAFSNERMRVIYDGIYIPQLLRTKRLGNDIALLKSRLPQKEVEELGVLDKQSKVFSWRIRDSLARRPHVMLAYTWTMYLALFNGGRWIRRQLASAGSHFWRGEVPPLSFWDFGVVDQDNLDEDQLKTALKAKFGEAASHLTDDERGDVVDETNRLFDLCSEMVDFLDQGASVNCPIKGSTSRFSPSKKSHHHQGAHRNLQDLHDLRIRVAQNNRKHTE
ncbi:hypothetical protein H2200_012544 [Cladophialophora chaetospira]|uniref:Heme oxygenase-like protein n=1 Tax=Cladophialophora chaetospira TaxID=386627 RepID=A0AA39CC16_9EURO|nr:hypothetical protein H2200_012544 [Cladophialophora chaetospira]